MSSRTFAEARAVLAAQPAGRLLGMELVELSRGYAELHVPVRPDLLRPHGHVPAGVLALAADHAISFAGGSVLGPAVVTGDLSLDHLRPTRGRIVRAVARVVSSASSRAVCHCDLVAGTGGAESLCATARGTTRVPGARR